MSVTVALVGNPNSGKTTVFNKITGSDQYVGNWAGVTVEKKQGRALKNPDLIITDLPGIYSLSPYSPEEVVTRSFLTGDESDAIINIIDASNLERNLFLTTQLLELDIPTVIVLNMTDAAQKNGIEINPRKLSGFTGCTVCEASAVKGLGITEAVDAVKYAGTKKVPPKFRPRVEKALAEISGVTAIRKRWTLIKIFERDIKTKLAFSRDQQKKIETIISDCENDLDDDSESIITNERYAYIERIVKCCITSTPTPSLSDKIDAIVTNRYLALPVFAIIMWLVYYIAISTTGAAVSRWTDNALSAAILYVRTFLGTVNVSAALISLICDAILSGVGSVLKFVPQMTLLFFALSLLEDCGYMARVAFIMDRIFRQFGLSGKSFIPLLISSGCGVPGIMASRTVENEKDRRLTIILTTFIPCGAKIPLIALISSSFFPSSTLIAPMVYFTSISAVILSALILKKTPLFSTSDSPFLMELPQYHLPSPRNLIRHVWTRVQSFIIKAGTVIFLACIAIWILSSFDFSLTPVSQEESILADIGKLIAPIFTPLGFGTWQFTLATLTGIIAKENAVGTISVLFGTSGDLSRILSVPAGISFMLFNLFCAPCVAAIAAVRKEMGDWRWAIFSVGYQTAFAYFISFIVYRAACVICGSGG